MTLSLYSTFKAWRRDVAAEQAIQKPGMVPQAGAVLYPALAMFGMGIGGVACGGDQDLARQG
jgi:hypothetical protein